MVMYFGQNGKCEFYKREDFGRDDGQSEVSMKQVVVRCNRCGSTYEDAESVQQVRKWLAEEGFAPCPNLSCRGQLEIKEVD